MKHDLQRRRLAAAIRPDQARQATGLNLERHTFEGGAPAFRPRTATAQSRCDECSSTLPSETAIEFVRVEADQIDVASDVVVQRVTIQSAHAHTRLFPSPPQHVALRACVRLDEHGQDRASSYCALDALEVLGRQRLALVDRKLGGELDGVVAAEIFERIVCRNELLVLRRNGVQALERVLLCFVDPLEIRLAILRVILFALRVELRELLSNELSVGLPVLDAHPEDRLVSAGYCLVEDLGAGAFQLVVVSRDLNERDTRAKVLLKDLRSGGLPGVALCQGDVSPGGAFGVGRRTPPCL